MLSAGATTALGTLLTAKQSAEQAYDNQESEQIDAYLAATLGPIGAVRLVNVNADTNANQVAASLCDLRQEADSRRSTPT